VFVSCTQEFPESLLFTTRMLATASAQTPSTRLRVDTMKYPCAGITSQEVKT